MDILPLEIKQMICGLLTPKDLKSVRLTAKEFSNAATIYLIPRLFLFYHPVSCAKVKQIAEHPIFSRHISTLVFDTSRLVNYSSLEDWVQGNSPHYYGRPAEDVRELYKSPSCQNKWKAHYEARAFQNQPGLSRLVLDSMAHAFSACPKLKNLIITTNHGEGGHAMRARTFEGVTLDDRAWCMPSDPDECMLSLTEILSSFPSHKSLHSLSIINAPLKNHSPPTLTFFQDLRHLRFCFGDRLCGFEIPEPSLVKLLRTAQSIETLWIDQSGYIPWFETEGGFLPAIHSIHLRDCMLVGFSPSVENLVGLFLRHASSLTQIDIGDCCLSQEDWSSALERVSCSLPHLKRIQLRDLYAGTDESGDYDQTLSLAYANKAARFIQYGEEAPDESLARDYSLDRDELDVKGSERSMQSPDEGLWADYERLANLLF